MQPAGEIARWALRRLDALNQSPIQDAQDALAYRNTLMIAILINCPIRLRNLSMIRIDKHLVFDGARYRLDFEPAEVKTDRYLSCTLPENLTPHLSQWLNHWRPRLMAASDHDAFWVGIRGAPMRPRGIYGCVISTTEAAFGVSINPHLFRDIAVSWIIDMDPAHAGITAPMLGHTNPRTTEEHYIQANQALAVRPLWAIGIGPSRSAHGCLWRSLQEQEPFMTNAAIYARYSSNHQRDASIDDQVRSCRKRIDAEAWQLIETYSDHAISGASTLRQGYQRMLTDARAGKFDILIAEALDRLSRDQEDIAGLFKQLTFAGVQLITLSEGEINELHVGLKGTMNALFLKDLAAKTRRGLEGRVRQGKSGGGNAYGYDVVKKVDSNGEPIRGERTINQEQADIIRRVFTEFSNGRSPRAIAHDLNAEDISGPRDGSWGPSTIYGNWRRGTGILNNDLYVGKLIWNRQHFIKDPQTGKRQARMNPESDWIIEDVPALRIIDEELWLRVKQRQDSTRRKIAEDNRGNRTERARRPRYLFSGLMQCGVCGGGYSKISQQHYGCSTARNKGTCDNMLTIRRDIVEETVLSGLKEQMMQPDAYKEFVSEFNREMNRLGASEDQERTRLATDLSHIDREPCSADRRYKVWRSGLRRQRRDLDT